MPVADELCGGLGHVRLLAGATRSGQPVYEVLPAEGLDGGIYVLRGSPGLVYGCAGGDRIRVDANGGFDVERRGGNLCLRIYPTGTPTDSDVEPLISAFARLDGIVEMPASRRFIVITVPVSAGFPAVEAAAATWASAHGCGWQYGNVYDEHDQPLHWWIDN
jgi:hypothetical protein